MVASPSPYPLNPPLAISCRNHQKSLAYFIPLAPLILLIFTKRQSQKGGSHGPIPPAPTYAPGDTSYPVLLRVLRLYQHNLL